MSLKTRILALATSAALMLSPGASLAEAAGYYAGELTPTVIADSYTGGQQINASMTFALQTGNITDEQVLAAQSLLSKCRLDLSFYDDFGTGRVRANMTLSDVPLLTADAMIFADGSVQMMTNLTGKYVLTLPAGTFVDGMLDLSALESEGGYYDMESPEFAALPPTERLQIAVDNMGTLLLSHLLGWVSGVQMLSGGRLYQFDDTYIEATETRDGVAQRMIGKVSAGEFCELLWNVVTTVDDTQGQLQQAIADTLAGMGVTRVQVRDAVDAMFTNEQINPAEDWVQSTWAVKQGDPNALCIYDDVSYFFKKLSKCVDNMWQNATDEYLDLIVSYDDFGGTVGLDARLPVFTTVLPYEGDFTYSLKTDENWQQRHTAHGELQILDDNHIIGDLTMVKGQDVDGVNESSMNGTLGVVNTVSGENLGFGVSGVLTSTLDTAGMGETITGSAEISAQATGMSQPVINANVNAKTVTDGVNFTIEGAASLSVMQELGIVANVTVQSGEYDEEPFAGGPAIDLTQFQLDGASGDALVSEVTGQAAKIGASFLLHPGVIADVTRLLGN